MKRFFVSALAVLGVLSVMAQPQMSWEEAEAKADEFIAKLTLEEKLSMTQGHNRFFFPGVPEKGMPYIYTTDASMGVKNKQRLHSDSEIKLAERTTQFPAFIMLAATFNPQVAYDYGYAVGEEARMAGAGVILGPGMNIYRNSQCGRNFEYLGEDPYLAARLIENYVTAMQSTGTLACAKHFFGNQTEFYRRRSNSIIDERAVMEIYTPAFKAAIDAGVATIMTAYNQYNGEWTGESKSVITDLLRGTLGFKGMVMSDWNSIYDWKNVILSGQNLDMPGEPAHYIKKTPRDLVAEGVVTEKDIENMIRPTIATCIRWGLYDRYINGEQYKPELEAKLPDHLEVSYRTAAEGAVLLKNNGILPLATDRKVLVVGRRWWKDVPHGGGAARVTGYDHVPLQKVMGETFGAGVSYVAEPTAEQIKAADVVLCVTGTFDSESTERPFAMEKRDEKAVRMAVENNPNTIVLVHSGSGIDMSAWADKCAALLYAWYPGQNGMLAIRDILIGKVNPSGKLPMTIERSFKDSPAVNSVPVGFNLAKAKGNPNEKAFHPWTYDVHYDESVLVGYRWYEKKGIEPLFPFGYGLSYTTFELANAKILSKGKVKTLTAEKPLRVAIDVKNTGAVAGAEVVQLYIAEKNPTVLRPVKELKSFRKVSLAAGEKQVVVFDVDKSMLSFWDDKQHAWTTNAGEYTLLLGTSSANIVAELPIQVL
ncbi:MAG: glycoside hydrolase family 3 C-terminal domain-containing protein [Alistipes sp.]|nr:glycoside hydrolase family 3 C-terminal domain-containing protein [Alistipes sp.]